MQADTNVIRDEARAPSEMWGEARGWAAKVWSKERFRAAGAAVAGIGGFLGLLGIVEYALFQVVQNWQVTGVGATVFGFF